MVAARDRPRDLSRGTKDFRRSPSGPGRLTHLRCIFSHRVTVCRIPRLPRLPLHLDPRILSESRAPRQSITALASSPLSKSARVVHLRKWAGSEHQTRPERLKGRRGSGRKQGRDNSATQRKHGESGRYASAASSLAKGELRSRVRCRTGCDPPGRTSKQRTRRPSRPEPRAIPPASDLQPCHPPPRAGRPVGAGGPRARPVSSEGRPR